MKRSKVYLLLIKIAKLDTIHVILPFYTIIFAVRIVSFREKIKNYFSRSREKHKLTFINDSNYQEKWSFRVSSFNLISLLGLYTIIILIGTILIFQYTPLKSVFDENNAYENEIGIDANAERIDSLFEKTQINESFLENIKSIINDEVVIDTSFNGAIDTLENYIPDFTKNESDSILRSKVEQSISSGSTINTATETYDFFFPPVNGLVSRSIDRANGHYGVDIVTLEDEPIKSCLAGTIVLTGWVQSEGKIIVVQHHGELISVYKHCSSILKQQGEQVQTGDPIGIVGNSGENTSGPHLHFELWKKGLLVNPEDYITF